MALLFILVRQRLCCKGRDITIEAPKTYLDVTMTSIKILRVPEVTQKTRMCKAAIYKAYRDDNFPRKIKMGRSVGFIESEIDAWILSKQERKSSDQVQGD